MDQKVFELCNNIFLFFLYGIRRIKRSYVYDLNKLFKIDNKI
jgi:hypothetical protein